MIPDINESLWFHELSHWFNMRQGIEVSKAFNAELSLVVDQFKGDVLVQLNHCGENPWLDSFSYKNQWIITPDQHEKKASLVTSFKSLPFPNDSVDCILAPLTIHPYSTSQIPIDELDRVLTASGYIIFLGINPHGFWGLQSLVSGSSCFNKKPIHLYSGYYLRRLMHHRGYRSCFWSSFYYIPPVRDSWIDRLEILNTAGQMLWAIPAGFYCYIVQKQTLSVIHPPLVQKNFAFDFGRFSLST